MPDKVHRCVKKVMEEQGVDESRAWAICNAAIDGNISVGMKDAAVSFTTHIDERTGFMKVNAVIARTGIQKYMPYELGDEGIDPIGVYRPIEEVTSPSSIITFTNVPITDDHPPEMVNIDNYSKYAKGSISNVNVVQLPNGITGLSTESIITDKDLIQSILNGKKELSVGYENVLVAKDGVYDSEPYKYVQTQIHANHVAVVDAGRCGSVCKLMIDRQSVCGKNLDQEGESSMMVTINGTDYDVPDEVAAELQRLQEALTAAINASNQEETTEGEATSPNSSTSESMDKATATIDALRKEIDKISKSVDSKVAAKVAVLKLADSNGIEYKETDDTLSIKKAIVSKWGFSTDGKTEAYLDTVIDIKKQEMGSRINKTKAAWGSFDAAEQNAGSKTNTMDAEEIGEREIK